MANLEDLIDRSNFCLSDIVCDSYWPQFDFFQKLGLTAGEVFMKMSIMYPIEVHMSLAIFDL